MESGEGGPVACSNKKTLGLRSWDKGPPSLPPLRVTWQNDMCPLSVYTMGRFSQIQSYDLICLLKPTWAHSPIYLVRHSEWESSQDYFLKDIGKNTISWWRTHKASICAVSESLCKSRHVILSGLETPGMDYPVWAVGLPSARQDLVSHLVWSSSWLYQGAARMTFKNFLSLFACALLPGVKRGEKETPEQWQSAGMILNLIQCSPMRLWTLVWEKHSEVCNQTYFGSHVHPSWALPR